MPDQKLKMRKDLLFWAGIFSFSAALMLFFQVFRGNIPELFPHFLIFTAALTLGAWTDKSSDNLIFRYGEITVAFAALFLFKRPECFALISGFISGSLTADAILRGIEAEGPFKPIRYVLYGGIFGIAITLFAGGWGILIASAGYAFFALFRKERKWLSAFSSLAFSILLLPAMFYAAIIVQPDRIVSQRGVPLHLRSHAIFAQLPDAPKRCLLISSDAPDAALIKSMHGTAARLTLTQWKMDLISGTPFKSVRSELKCIETKYDMILVDLHPGKYPFMTKEFIRELKGLLEPGGQVFYCLPDGDYLHAASIRAALASSFQHTSSAGGVFVLAASDSPMGFKDNISGDELLDFILFSREFERETAQLSEKAVIASDSNFAFERFLLSQKTNPVLKWFSRCFPLSAVVFSSVLTGSVILFLLLRYFLAYIPDMGLRLTVYRDSVLIFLIPAILLLSKAFSNQPGNYSYLIALTVFTSGLLAGEKLPVKFAFLGIWFSLLCVGLSSLFPRVPFPGAFFCALGLLFFAGVLLPLMLQGTLEKYKTGTSGKVELFPILCSGLLTALLITAAMPDHLYFGSIFP